LFDKTTKRKGQEVSVLHFDNTHREKRRKYCCGRRSDKNAELLRA
jgi:hypothetical protein